MSMRGFVQAARSPCMLVLLINLRGWILSYEKTLFQYCTSSLRGDYSGCFLGLVDINTNIAFQYMLLILKCSPCFDANNTRGTTSPIQ